MNVAKIKGAYAFVDKVSVKDVKVEKFIILINIIMVFIIMILLLKTKELNVSITILKEINKIFGYN